MDAVDRARVFFQTYGRDIDRARFGYHFSGRPLDDMLAALGRYQNSDGGFGQGLEVDIKAPDSNPFATELALLACLQAGVPRDHVLLKAAVGYLERMQDDDGGWHLSPDIPPEQMAPWYQTWQWPNLNPACSLAGLLQALSMGSEQLHARVESLFDRLATPGDVASDDFYRVRPYAYYFFPEWEHPQREFYLSGLLWWLIRQNSKNTLDGTHFFEYIRTPNTYTGRHLPRPLLNERLDMLADEQAEDGGWPTPYDPAWRGWITVQNLLVLRAFGRA